MKVQYLNGGLANQVFQYIFFRYLEIKQPDENCFLDDSFFFFNDVHNGYELEKVFSVTPHLLSRYFTPDVWEELIKSRRNGISIPQIIKNQGDDICMIAEADNYKTANAFDGAVYEIPNSKFFPEVASIRFPNVYYHGYWIHSDWYRSCREILAKELVFPPLTDKNNLSYAQNINSTWSIAVHIRRGDYVNLNWAIPPDYYLNSMKKFHAAHPEGYYFIFSDDIPWCKENAAQLGLKLPSDSHVSYVEGNVYGRNYIDLQLMSMCRGMVMSNSAFCFLAVLLSGSLEEFISLPMKKMENFCKSNIEMKTD